MSYCNHKDIIPGEEEFCPMIAIDDRTNDKELTMPASLLVTATNGAGATNGTIILDSVLSLSHFGITTLDMDFPALFGDIKFICTGGSAGRMASYAKQFSAFAMVSISENLSRTDRYVLYKTGPVLWVNHGIGVPSLSIMLIEMFKLIRQAGATSVKLIRIGTCGGVGVEPGTVVVSNGVLNGAFEQKHIQWIQGRMVKREALLDQPLGKELFETAKGMQVPTEQGITFCADDFYEGQMRLDGYFCDYSQEDKLAFLQQLNNLGVKNIEMESTGFAALAYRAQIPAAICCVALVNRMEGDGILMDKAIHAEFETRPFRIVSQYILRQIRANEQQQNGNGH